MKKLFINCPIEHRKQEDIDESIRKIHAIAEIEFGEKLEVIPLPSKTYKDDYRGRMEHLADLIKAAIPADYFVTAYYNRGLWLVNNEFSCALRSMASRNPDSIIWMDTKRIMPDVDDIQKATYGHRIDDEF